MQKELITHLFYRIFKARGSGLKKHKPDPRNFKTVLFNWGTYTPKQQRLIVQPVFIKDQNGFNTCQWNATAAQKEVDEKMELNVRSIVGWGVKNGRVSGNGFSNLEDGQKALKDWGILEKQAIPEDLSWPDYANIDVQRYATLAAIHKSSSYWQANSRNDALHLLDDNHTITTGINWYTGFNQGGGFGPPWLISKAIGYKVGGHAIKIVGYDLNYQGQKVYIIQNSYGKDWGDNGLFYITMDYLDYNNYGYYVNLDLPSQIGLFLNQFDGKNVKGSKSTVYFIQAGKKKAYPDEIVYLSFTPQDTKIQQWTLVKDTDLAQVPDGNMMDIKKSLYWDYLKNIDGNEARIQRLLQILHSS